MSHSVSPRAHLHILVLPRLTGNPLVIILAGAMFGFCLARLSYLNIGGGYSNGAAPGEWYWFSHGHYRIGITLHLVTVIPAGLLMVFQFVPVIRHHFILIHRINGYLVILLVFLGNVGALMVARRAFGGYLSTQSAVGMLVIMTTTGISLAYYNIKKLQIEQHRAWMLRSMIYLGTIITTRLIMIISALITTKIGSYYSPMTCGELTFIMNRAGTAADIATKYPQCIGLNSTTIDSIAVAVHASFGNNAEEIGGSLRLSFGMALWLSLFLHTVGPEIYLALTPREAQRLREVSYQRQLEAGYKNPGSAGLVVERFGDANEWRKMED